jgi:hypothetical protein
LSPVFRLELLEPKQQSVAERERPVHLRLASGDAQAAVVMLQA